MLRPKVFSYTCFLSDLFGLYGMNSLNWGSSNKCKLLFQKGYLKLSSYEKDNTCESWNNETDYVQEDYYHFKFRNVHYKKKKDMILWKKISSQVLISPLFKNAE